MAEQELPPIIQRITIEGTDEVTEAFNKIKEAGEKVFEALEHASLGGIFIGIVETLAAVSLAAVGTGAGLFILSNSAATATVEMEHLAKQAELSIEDMSGLTAALSSQGANTDGLAQSFKRLAVSMQSILPSIAKEWRDAADKVIDNNLKIRESLLSVQKSVTDLAKAEVDAAFQSSTAAHKKVEDILSVKEAFLSVEKAQRNLQSAITGDQTDPQIEQVNKIKDAELALAKAIEARKAAKDKAAKDAALAETEEIEATNKLAEAQLKVEQAAQQAAEAQKKAIEDQANSIPVLAKAMEDLANGITTNLGKANLTVENMFKGFVANVAGGEKALSQFQDSAGNINQIAVKVGPGIFQLADIFKNLESESQKTALGFKVFGRGVTEDVINAMSLGGEGLKAFIEKQKQLHLVMTEEEEQISHGLHIALINLTRDFTTTKDQIGNLFAPAFTQGLQELETALQKNHDKIIEFAEGIANQVEPVIKDFFHVLATGGDTKDTTTFIGPLVDGLKVLYTFVKDVIGPTIIDFFRVINGQPAKQEWVNNLVTDLKLVGTVVGGVIDIFTNFGKTVGPIFTVINDLINSTIKGFNDLFGTKFQENTSLMTKALDLFSAALKVPLLFLTPLLRLLAAVSEQLGKLLPGSVGKAFEDFGKNITKTLDDTGKELDTVKQKAEETAKAVENAHSAGKTDSHGNVTTSDDTKNAASSSAGQVKEAAQKQLAEANEIITDMQEAMKFAFAKIGGDAQSEFQKITLALDKESKGWVATVQQRVISIKDQLAGIAAAANSDSGRVKIPFGPEFIDAQKQIAAMNEELKKTGEATVGASKIIDVPTKLGIQAQKATEALDKLNVDSSKLGEDQKLDAEVTKLENLKKGADDVAQSAQKLDQIKAPKLFTDSDESKIKSEDEALKSFVQSLSQANQVQPPKLFDDGSPEKIKAEDEALKSFVSSLGQVSSSDGLNKVNTDVNTLTTSTGTLQEKLEGIKGTDFSGLDASTTALNSVFDTLNEKASKLLETLQQIGQTKVDNGSASSPAPQGGTELAGGGHIRGPGTSRSDSIPIWASDFEYMIQAPAVKHYGVDFMHTINRMLFKMPKFALGGLINSSSDTFLQSFNPQSSLNVNNFFSQKQDSSKASKRIDLHFGSNVFSVNAADNVADKLERFAVSSKIASNSRKPGWYGK